MSIPESHLKERLSVAYVKTVAAKAGAQYLTPDGTEYGTDGVIARVTLLSSGKYVATGWDFHCQLKATTSWIENNEHIIYDMDAEAYNKLVNWDGNSPCLLVLLRLPKVKEEWLNMSEINLILKNCCYWEYLTGDPTNNVSKIRIRIPRRNLFTPQALNYLLDYMQNNQGKLPS